MNFKEAMSKTRIALMVGVILLAVFGFTTTRNKTDDGQVNIGDKAPELAFYNTDSTKVIALSSLQGKYVLVDFWASWCRPCRMENPNVVRVYEKYNKAKFKDAKGFTIYSVSLDKSRGAWVKAIEQDNLNWPNHVSDLRAWSSAGAQIYGVNAIPMNFLIGPDGKVIAKNLRGDQLDRALDPHVKRF